MNELDEKSNFTEYKKKKSSEFPWNLFLFHIFSECVENKGYVLALEPIQKLD